MDGIEIILAFLAIGLLSWLVRQHRPRPGVFHRPRERPLCSCPRKDSRWSLTHENYCQCRLGYLGAPPAWGPGEWDERRQARDGRWFVYRHTWIPEKAEGGVRKDE